MMERLTKKGGEGGRMGISIREAIDRLAAYEDSGLTSEEVMELSKIVRCGECKYYQKDDCTMNDFFDFFETRKNAFCSFGERKVEKHENV